MIKIGPYKACIIDLVIDDKTGKVSPTKFWTNVAYAVMTYLMIINKEISPELMLSYGGIVGGSYLGKIWLTRHYDKEEGDTTQSSTTEESTVTKSKKTNK